MSVQKVRPFLCYNHQAEEAVNFYLTLFPNSKIRTVARYGEGSPAPAGSVMVVDFELDGCQLLALNGGPIFQFTEAISLVVNCEDQAEIDHYWYGLTEGGTESQCGWLKDRYGLSWQVVPSMIGEVMSDPVRGARAMQAVMQMKKFDMEKFLHAAGMG